MSAAPRLGRKGEKNRQQHRAFLEEVGEDKIIEKQTEMTVSALEDIAKNLMTMESNQIWKGLLEKRNLEIEELLHVEALLKSAN